MPLLALVFCLLKFVIALSKQAKGCSRVVELRAIKRCSIHYVRLDALKPPNRKKRQFEPTVQSTGVIMIPARNRLTRATLVFFFNSMKTLRFYSHNAPKRLPRILISGNYLG